MMNRLGLAISIAAINHQDQVDKGGKPYILHPMRVMNSVAHLGEEYMIAAILHDVVEDTDVSIESVRTLFSENVTKAVHLLTRKKNQSYEEYIDGIMSDDIARQVKIADIKDNTDVTRLKGLRDKDFDRMKKYHQTYVKLTQKNI